MNTEAQNQAIATACGWKPYHIPGCINYTMFGPEWTRCDPWVDGKPSEDAKFGPVFEGCPPDYLGDLNAMHAAEAACMIPMEDGTYYFELERVIERDRGIKLRNSAQLGFSGWLIHATAAQRAEAFLRTLNLWTE